MLCCLGSFNLTVRLKISVLEAPQGSFSELTVNMQKRKGGGCI